MSGVGYRQGQGRAGTRRTEGDRRRRRSLAEAGAVLTAWRSVISPVPQEYDEVARGIEKAGGFLHVKGSACEEKGAAQ